MACLSVPLARWLDDNKNTSVAKITARVLLASQAEAIVRTGKHGHNIE